MTEKELIVNFIWKLDNEKWRGIIPNYDAIDEWVDEYLEEHHKDYHEALFLSKLRPLNIVDDRTLEQKRRDGDD